MKKQFGDRLKELRIENNMTQEELAKKFNTGKASISHYESNRRMPDASTIEKFADFFNVSVDYILGRTNNKEIISHENSNTNNVQTLTKRDEKEIEKIIEQTRKQLESSEGLMFNGEPASPEAIQSIIDAMKVGMEIAKQRNKEKYTPKKYRKDKK
ncbi:helix-turn-helix transcriptional regulator [Crassaminicella thermophila]|uniref:Helix-turn-helix transcriptional regulator n=1 Tax=Crassaminicella thermophila TaxID=2599308 RepID=A0A5C0SG86_CRATE|nr:helix-turn-helix transcriptional regulator [Crassaminicella thermophila]QEK12756.1 helix-turn-helix transcriptional regulator [Crassaminicella thermophila]